MCTTVLPEIFSLLTKLAAEKKRLVLQRSDMTGIGLYQHALLM